MLRRWKKKCRWLSPSRGVYSDKDCHLPHEEIPEGIRDRAMLLAKDLRLKGV